MSDTTTRRMLRAYEQRAEPSLFLTSFFQSPPENFHASEAVELDIVRSDEDVAIVIQDLSTGARWNSTDIYTNKSFVPPIFREAVPINAFDLIKRFPGQHPFESVDFRGHLIARMMQGMRKVEAKIRRAVELQASQILQTGVLTLIDSGGLTLFSMDFKPKASHFPTVSISWDQATATIVADLTGLADQILDDGKVAPNQLIFGADAWEEFITSDKIKPRFDLRRAEQGIVEMSEMRGGGLFRGVAEIGNYKFDLWSYNARYAHQQTGTSTPFVTAGKVIMRASTGRMDATFGAVPNINQILGQPQLLPELPQRFANGDGRVDLFPNVYKAADGSQLLADVAARPLLIPTAIDTYGCLTT